MAASCFVCQKHSQGSEVPSGVIYEDGLTYVGHLLPGDLTDVYLGYLMLEPKRHVARLGDLTEMEAAAIGRLTNDVARALRDVEGAEHVYSLVLGDAVPHLHIHLIPRYPGTPREYWGLKVDQWPGARKGGVAEVQAVSGRLRKALLRTGPANRT